MKIGNKDRRNGRNLGSKARKSVSQSFLSLSYGGVYYVLGTLLITGSSNKQIHDV